MHTILLIVLPVVFAATASAISCYSCESVYEPHCGDEFDMENYWKLDCSRVSAPRYLRSAFKDISNATGCMKKVYKVDGKKRVERNCFFGKITERDIGCKTDPALLEDMIAEMDCLVCDNASYCNAAQTVRSAKVIWIWCITTLVFFSLTHLFN